MARLLSHHAVQPAGSPTAACRRQLHFSCYDVDQIAHAYGIDTLHRAGLTGRGRTIVIVDAYGSPTVRRDLAVFSRQHGLPRPDLTISYPDGRPPAFRQTADRETWALESELDTQLVHAYAPAAKIVLALAPSDHNGPFLDTLRKVIRRGQGDVLSQSFGNAEPDAPAETFVRFDSVYAQAATTSQTTFVASTGDEGVSGYQNNGQYFKRRVIEYPSSSPHVTAVGGTQLHLDAAGERNRPDNVWNDQALFGGPAAGTGGVSEVFRRPAYQNSVHSTVGRFRGVPDVSLSAAVDGGVLIRLSYPGLEAGYYIIGGTSEAAPTLAAIVALADQRAGHRLGEIQDALYAHRSMLTDITRGNNTVSFGHATVRGYDATAGYDLASGLGTAQAPKLVRSLTAHG